MSDTDSFIDEVTEEVRRDRLFGYFRRYGWIAGLLIFGLVGITAYNEWNRSEVEKVEQARGDALLTALSLENDTKISVVINAIAVQDSNNIIANFLAAGFDEVKAAELLNGVISNINQPKFIQDLARLKLAITPDAVTQDEAVLILTDLSSPGGFYRNVAIEILVALELERGNPEVAIDILQSHVQDAEASQAQVQRMGELIVELGSNPKLATQFDSDNNN